MEKKKVVETIGKVIVKTFEVLAFNPESVYEDVEGYNLSQWRHRQELLAGGAGAGAAAIPVFHYATLPADIAWLINRMDACCYGIGAIIGRESNKGKILEKEDLANILALWGDHTTVYQLEKITTERPEGSFNRAAGRAGLATLVATSLGVMGVGGLTAPLVAKVATKLGAKITAKAALGLIPLAGAVVSGGINVWLVSSISNAAEKYYGWKAEHWR